MIEQVVADVAIVGGGIVGSSAALFLRRRGLSVALLERGLCGAAASGVNYGGVRTQGREILQLPLSLRARSIWSNLQKHIGIDGEYVQSGHLKMARTEDDLQRLITYRDAVREHGLVLRMITGEEFRRRFPWAGDAAIGASFCAGDGHANPRLVSPGFAQAARMAGARIVENCDVTQIEHDGFAFVIGDSVRIEVRSKWLLNCAGAWGLSISERFGDSAPMTSIHPNMVVTEPVPRFMDVNVGVEGGGVYGRQTSRGNCVLGGGRGRARNRLYAAPSATAIDVLSQRISEFFPALRNAHLIRCWTGVEGSLPDHQPVIHSNDRLPQLMHAFGFCGAGFQTGPAVGELLAEWIDTGNSAVDLAAFSLARFASHTNSTSKATPSATTQIH